ncbi:UDP-4-amino-4,6-dideoxy-N-acetyl-beta-L-altrosamine transaminase [candidate division KSB1 bacterium]
MNEPARSVPYARHWIGEEEIEAVAAVLRSDWITQGPIIDRFEEKLVEYTGSRFAVAFSSGTAALHGAAFAAGIRPDQTVITSPITFVASANCVLYQGGQPAFADIDSSTGNIDPGKLRAVVTQGVAGLIPVHYAGRPCSMAEISRLASEENLFVIEDASHALGTSWSEAGREYRMGCCRYSDMTMFSFHPAKTIATGEGGAVTTNREDLHRRLLLFRTHGITKDPDLLERNEGPWYYEMQQIGYNYRITDFQCALGLVQLERLDNFIARRRDIVARYNSAFSELPGLEIPSAEGDARIAWHIYVVRLNLKKLTVDRRTVFEALRHAGLGVQVHFIPVHLQPYYRDRFGFQRGDFPVAEEFYQRVITLPLFPRMSDEDVEFVIETVRRVLAGYTG